jgi:hypothetical protein
MFLSGRDFWRDCIHLLVYLTKHKLARFVEQYNLAKDRREWYNGASQPIVQLGQVSAVLSIGALSTGIDHMEIDG